MTQRKYWLASLSTLALFCLAEWIWPFVWVSPSIVGRVFDKDSHVPVEGATVAVIWNLEGGAMGIGPLDVIRAVEVPTDNSGYYRIPAWGPRFHFGIGSVYSDNQPRFFVTHEGYLSEVCGRRLQMVRNRAWFLLTNEGHNCDIQKAINVSALQARNQEVYSTLVYTMSLTSRCKWAALRSTLIHLSPPAIGSVQSNGVDSGRAFIALIESVVPCG